MLATGKYPSIAMQQILQSCLFFKWWYTDKETVDAGEQNYGDNDMHTEELEGTYITMHLFPHSLILTVRILAVICSLTLSDLLHTDAYWKYKHHLQYKSLGHCIGQRCVLARD